MFVKLRSYVAALRRVKSRANIINAMMIKQDNMMDLFNSMVAQEADLIVRIALLEKKMEDTNKKLLTISKISLGSYEKVLRELSILSDKVDDAIEDIEKEMREC